MSYPPTWWTPPTPPPPPPRRFATKWVWVGIGAGIAATLVGPLLGLAAGRVARLSALSAGLSLVGFVVPLVAGIVLAAMQGPPQRRGVGLGLIIGWALAPIIFAGACIVILIAAYSQTGS